MEKLIIEWLLSHGYIGIVIIISIVTVTVIIMVRINKLLDIFKDLKDENENLKKQYNIMEKRTRKICQIMGQCPSITIANKLWVQDDKRNGGSPPDKNSNCKIPYKGLDTSMEDVDD